MPNVSYISVEPRAQQLLANTCRMDNTAPSSSIAARKPWHSMPVVCRERLVGQRGNSKPKALPISLWCSCTSHGAGKKILLMNSLHWSNGLTVEKSSVKFVQCLIYICPTRRTAAPRSSLDNLRRNSCEACLRTNPSMKRVILYRTSEPSGGGHQTLFLVRT